MATAAQPQPAALPLPGRRADATVTLHPLLCGEALSPPGWLHREKGRLAGARAFGVTVPRDELVPIPIVAFLLEHPGVGPVLVDTGLHPSVAIDPKQNFGRLGALAFKGMKMDPAQAVAAQLRERAIEPGDVEVVVMTHLHVDHASGMSEFPDATFLFDRREWAAATAPRARLHGYSARQFDHAFEYRLIDFEGEATESFAGFGRSLDVFGDGSVRLVSTPGHTHGHVSVVVRTSQRELLLAGDAIYTTRALHTGELPYRVEDVHLYRRSLREIQLYAERTPGALIIPGHDMGAWKKLERVYA